MIPLQYPAITETSWPAQRIAAQLPRQHLDPGIV